MATPRHWPPSARTIVPLAPAVACRASGSGRPAPSSGGRSSGASRCARALLQAPRRSKRAADEALRGGAGLHLGHQLVRPVGRGAGQGAGEQGARGGARLPHQEPQRAALGWLQRVHHAPAQPVRGGPRPAAAAGGPHRFLPLWLLLGLRAVLGCLLAGADPPQTPPGEHACPDTSAGALQRHAPGLAVQGIAQAGRRLRRYLEGKARLLYPEPEDVFPCDLIDSDTCRPPSSYV